MTRKTVLTNLFWRFAERCGAQGVSFVVQLVLARLLMPEDYGTVAIVAVIINILSVFVDSGLGNALIQKKDADDVDFSTVFYTNVLFCLVLYGLLFATAPLVSAFYREPQLTALIRVLGLTLVISGVKNVQQAYVSRNMLFKRFFFATLGGTRGAALIGIGMALAGLGVWALVAQQIFNITMDTLILWLSVKWRPTRAFSLERLQGLFSYGWKFVVSGLLDTVYTDLRQMIIGKMYSAGDLAFYNRGEKFPQFIIQNVNNSIDSVLLPTMSAEQSNVERVRAMTRRSIKTSVYIMAPLMVGLAVTAPVFIRLLLTEKWLPCVPYLRIFCITYLFYPIHSANLNAIKAMGRSDLFLKLEIQKKIIGMVLLLSTMWFGVMAMAYSLLVSCAAGQLINSWPNRRLLGYSYRSQLADILPSAILALVMGVPVLAVPFAGWNGLFTLTVQILLGGVVYIGGSALLRLEPFIYLLETAKQLLHRKSATDADAQA